MQDRTSAVCSSRVETTSIRRMQMPDDQAIPSPEELAGLVREHIPDAEVNVGLFSGNDHFEMRVVSKSFHGKTRVAQHKMVYAALGEHMRERVHALALTTHAPETQE